MSKKSIDERLKAHPLLEGRIEAILDIVEDSAREVERADEAERRMIEEVRPLGNEAVRGWAECKVGEQEGTVSCRERESRETVKKLYWYTRFGPIEVVEPILIQGGHAIPV
jgi:hypothetical protein